MTSSQNFISFPSPPVQTSSHPDETLLFLIETLYYLGTLVYAPSYYPNHILKRLSLSLLGLIISLYFNNLTKPKYSSAWVKCPSFLVLNFMFILNEIRFLGSLQLVYLSEKDKENLVLDVVLESFWRLLILQNLSSSWFIKAAHIITSRILFSIVAPGAFELGFIRFICESVLFCLPSLFSLKKEAAQQATGYEKDLYTILRWFKSIPEGALVVNSKGQIKFINNYLKNVFGDENRTSLKEISQSLQKFEFMEASMQIISNAAFTPKVLIASRNFQNNHTSGYLGIDSTNEDYRKRIQEISSLEELYMSYINEIVTREVVEKYMPTFQAKYYHQEHAEWASLEIKAHLLSEEGEEKHLIILINDVTDRESKIISLEKEKILYRDNLIASFSHELRTPLNSNLAFLEQCMESQLVPYEVKKKLIQPALTSGRSLFFIISDILDYSLMMANELYLEIKPLNILHTVNLCVELVKEKAAQKKLHLNVAMEGHVNELVYTDHQRVTQVLVNLLNNAIQFTMKGSIEVIVSSPSSDAITICVKDTGIGMDITTQHNLKEKLTKEKLKEKLHEHSVGIGLGLFISDKIVKTLNSYSHEGVKFVSQKGLGSKFYFTITNQKPTHRSVQMSKIHNKMLSLDTEEDCSLDTIIKEYDTRSMKNAFRINRQFLSDGPVARVLIVDDEVFNIIVLENFCKSLGITTERAFNGQEALKKLSLCAWDRQAPIRLVFMDINMPIMDGYQAATKIMEMIKRGEIPHLEIIGVTAYVSKDKIDQTYKCGMSQVISKPLSKALLIDVLKRHGIICTIFAFATKAPKVLYESIQFGLYVRFFGDFASNRETIGISSATQGVIDLRLNVLYSYECLNFSVLLKTFV